MIQAQLWLISKPLQQVWVACHPEPFKGSESPLPSHPQVEGEGERDQASLLYTQYQTPWALLSAEQAVS